MLPHGIEFTRVRRVVDLDTAANGIGRPTGSLPGYCRNKTQQEDGQQVIHIVKIIKPRPWWCGFKYNLIKVLSNGNNPAYRDLL